MTFFIGEAEAALQRKRKENDCVAYVSGENFFNYSHI